MVTPEQFFRPSPFLRWTLVHVLVLFGICMLIPGGIEEWTPACVLISIVLSSMSLLYAAALLFPRRCGWARRVVAALVFLTFVAYLVDELRSGHEFRRPGSRR